MDTGNTNMPPVAIGGVGGSGTRIVAQLVRAAGIHMGTDLNAADDALWFTLLFKWPGILDCNDERFDRLTEAMLAGLTQGAPLPPSTEALVRSLATHDRPPNPAGWLQLRVDSLIAAARQPAHGKRWGWKEPNTHLVIERLWQRLPSLRYVHVVRNGVDMAYSRKQTQPQVWGARVLGVDGPVTPRRSLAYWCAVHKRMHRLLMENQQRMFWLDYDALCRDPQGEAAKLCRFLGFTTERLAPVLQEIRAPSKRDCIDLRDFDASDLDYVRSLGYAY